MASRFETPRQKVPLMRCLYANVTLDEAQACGHDAKIILMNCGLAPETKLHDDDLVPSSFVYKVWSETSRAMDNPYLSFEIGHRRGTQGLANFPPLLDSSATLADMLTKWLMQSTSFSAAQEFQLDIRPHRSTYRGVRTFVAPDEAGYGDAWIIGSIVGPMALNLKDRWDPEMLTVRVRMPELIPPEVLPPASVVQGDAQGIALNFPTHWLTATRGAEHECSTISESLPNAIRNALYVMDHSISPKIDAVAAAMGLSIKKLQLAMKAHGIAYEDILDETKRDLAIARVLRGEETIAEIAFALGYANSSNFARAFRRWTGMTPAEFLQMRTVRGLDSGLAAVPA